MKHLVVAALTLISVLLPTAAHADECTFVWAMPEGPDGLFLTIDYPMPNFGKMTFVTDEG